MPAKKRKYTFRKGKIVPYESGSPAHMADKAWKEITRPPKKRKKISLF